MARRSIHVPARSATDLRRLPDQVLLRLREGFGGQAVAARHRGADIDVRGRVAEQREHAGRVELRAEADSDNPVVEGHAAIWDEAYDVWGGPPWGWTEHIVTGACDDCLADLEANGPVYLFFDHRGLPLASTRAGTLDLSADRRGLLSVARPDPESSHSTEVVSRLRRGELDAMSWAFSIGEGGRQEWNEDYTKRWITKVERMYDVSVVSFPANPATEVGLRSERSAPQPSAWAGHQVARRQRRSELRALPDEVLTRGLDLAAITTRRRRQELVEARTSTPALTVAYRDDGSVRLDGYIAVYDEPYPVAGGPDARGWTEIVTPGAAARSVDHGADVRLMLNGEGMPLARSKADPPTLVLRSDDYGVHLSATLDADAQQCEDVVLAVQRGDDVAVQVGFEVIRQRWDVDHQSRTVEEMRLHDVNLVTVHDPTAAEGLAELHNSRALVDVQPDSEHLSLELARAQCDSLAL